MFCTVRLFAYTGFLIYVPDPKSQSQPQSGIRAIDCNWYHYQSFLKKSCVFVEQTWNSLDSDSNGEATAEELANSVVASELAKERELFDRFDHNSWFFC